MGAALRSERLAAVVLVAAALVGLALANSPLATGFAAVLHARWGPVPGLELSTEHWISDGLLAAFFLVAAIELKHELARGELSSPAKAARPLIAAVCGVATPALVYLAIAGPAGFGAGWPIPTATDVAFALGVLALVGRGLPSRIRVFLLALAVIDDLIAIVLIAVFFTAAVDLVSLALAVVCVIGFGVLVRIPEFWVQPISVALAGLAWWFVLQSGVHATIAGVALGLALPVASGGRLRHALEPWVNGVVLPLFALAAAAVAIPAVSPGQLSPVFWAVLVALPVGKIVGIGIGGWVGAVVEQRRWRGPSPLELAALGALGGIGFTVSLLMNELAFRGREELATEGTLAVLAGSAVSVVAASVLVSLLSRRHRARAAG
ncbi:Na+/H+ antiporter NhaA [Galbitalea sp. SE-J8]|uniref:Na+/H+ antiporter NhaA n=1 Tax=Galbitalea sp. SE-J8 TaxID=3054952 RepID=UPI00259CEBEF|nr:Na+/H+ antiporter NhaA [Galbitalea sp. SE-J8]MDM4761397.1 Na+/H+ antiporter NhaA [Galbitalea sp. SE-J8]